MVRYGIRRRLKTGIRVRIRPTLKCSLDCYYCGNKMGFLKERPIEKFTITGLEWLKLIDKVPWKIKEVWISGGEPSIYPDIIPLIKGLLKRNYLVTIFSNLTNTKLAELPKSDLIRIEATFHSRAGHSKDNFLKNYWRIKNRVDVVEIDDNQLSFSESKPWNCDIEDAKRIRKHSIYISPEGRIHFCAYDETMNMESMR